MLMEDSESKVILERASERRKEKPRGILPWRVTQHEDWLDRVNGALVAGGDDGEKGIPAQEAERVNGEIRDPKVLLEAFKQGHPDITADMDDMAKIIKVCHVHILKQIWFLNGLGRSSFTSQNSVHH